MNFFEDEQKLTEHFTNYWGQPSNEYRGIPVELSSEKTPPNEDGEVVRFRIKRSTSLPFAIGGSRRNFGSVIVQVVSKNGNGPGRILKIAGKVSEAFVENGRPVRVNGNIVCRVPSGDGPHEEGVLTTMNVDVPFFSSYSG